MHRLLLVFALSILWGFGYGYFVVGRWRLDLVLGSGWLGAVAWKIGLQAFGMLGSMAVFAAVFYPLRPVEVLASFVLTFVAVVASERFYRRVAGQAARSAGLIGGEDL